MIKKIHSKTKNYILLLLVFFSNGFTESFDDAVKFKITLDKPSYKAGENLVIHFDITMKKKFHIIIWAILMLTMPIDWRIPISDRFYVILQATANINMMIAELKKGEIRSNVYKDAKFNILTRNNYMLPNN